MVSRGVDLIVPAAIYNEWTATGLAPEQPPPGVRLMVVDVDRLASLLAARVTAIIPDGFHVEASDGMLWYSVDDGRFPGQLSNYEVGTSGTYVRVNFEGRGLAGVAEQALDELQDYVDEATHDPWPGDRTPPRAHAEIRDGALHMWYGGADPKAPVFLACEPIQLADLQHAS